MVPDHHSTHIFLYSCICLINVDKSDEFDWLVWFSSLVSPGWRRQPDLFVWCLFVDDVGPMVSTHLHCQYTTLDKEQRHISTHVSHTWNIINHFNPKKLKAVVHSN